MKAERYPEKVKDLQQLPRLLTILRSAMLFLIPI